MYAKIFSQIYDSSIANDWQVRVVFEDLLVLADSDGVVDMTQEAISARTRIPLEIVTRAIVALQEPDLRSRSPEHDGRRLILLNSHRDWGWLIVNYQKYRLIKREFDRRSYMRKYMNTKRLGKPKACKTKSLTEFNQSLTSPSPSSSSYDQEGGMGETPVSTPDSDQKREGVVKPMLNSSLTEFNNSDQEGGTVESRPVEFPPRFPTTKEASRIASATVGCPPEFADLVWSKAAGRGGRDARDIPIRSWQHHLATEWAYQQERIAKGKFTASGQPSGNIFALKTRLTALEDVIAGHVANRNAIRFDPKCTKEQMDELRGFLKKKDEIIRQMATGEDSHA